MGEVIAFKRQSLKEKHKGKSLCKHGFHKWKLETESKFDTKQGKLVSVFTCERCKATKNVLK
jgi:hypothetical protein